MDDDHQNAPNKEPSVYTNNHQFLAGDLYRLGERRKYNMDNTVQYYLEQHATKKMPTAKHFGILLKLSDRLSIECYYPLQFDVSLCDNGALPK